SAITRAVGTEPTVEVDAFTVDAEPGDLYLICSDGLTDMLTEEELEDVLAKTAADPARAADALVAAANARGGEDNITVVLFEMTPRNRELAALFVAAGVAGAALSTVTIEVSHRAAGYGAVFAALYLCAHVVVRRTVPYADGGLLPLAALMTAIGLTTITRLDP